MPFGFLGSDAIFHGASAFVDPATLGTWDPTGASDSTSALQAALAIGGDILIGPGTYLVNGIELGNGSNGTASTVKPTRLIGLGGGSGLFPQFGNPGPSVTFKFNGSAGGTLMQIAGPLQGWGIEGIGFDGNNSAATLLQVISAQFGYTKNLSFKGWTGVAFEETCWATRPGGWSNINTMHNVHSQHVYYVPSVANCIAQLLTGNSGIIDNTSYDTFINHTFINPAAAGVTISDLYLQSCDSNTFINYHHINGDGSTHCVVFDYTFDASHHFPTSNFFFNLDPSGSASAVRFTAIGSLSGQYPNMVIGYDQANGATTANATISGLSFLGTLSASLKNWSVDENGNEFPHLISVATPTNANAATAGVPLNALYRDTADPSKVYVRTV